MERFWTKQRRELCKDISAIFTPWMVAALTIGGGVWLQKATSDRSENQARLGLAIGILQSEPKDTDTDNKLRDWAIHEFGRQTGEPFSTDFTDLLKGRPDIFRLAGEALAGGKATGGITVRPGAMPQMPIPDEFNDPMVDSASLPSKK